MANYWCKCNYRLSNSAAPDLVTWEVYSEKEWQDIIKLGVIDVDELPDPNIDVWRCPKCERFYVFKNNKVVKYYVLYDIYEINNKLISDNYKCKCGNIFDNKNLNYVRWRVYSDSEWWDIFTNDVRIFNPADIPPPNIDIWSCSKCERVYVFKDNNLIKYYVAHDIKELRGEHD